MHSRVDTPDYAPTPEHAACVDLSSAPSSAAMSPAEMRRVLLEAECGREPSREQRHDLTAHLLHQAHHAADEETREDALGKVVVLNMAVARALAAQHRNKGIAREDLEQVAYLALVKAVHRFDNTREGDLLSYAVPTIRGEIRKYFRDRGWTVRPPRGVQEIQSHVINARVELTRAGNPVPTVAQIAEHLGLDDRAVSEALTAEGCFIPSSLDAPMAGASDTSLGATLAVDDDRERDSAEARVVLRPVIRRLRARDQRILQMRYYEEYTQQQIAEEIGVTQMQVSRILTRIHRDLKTWIGPLDTDEHSRDTVPTGQR